MRSFLQEIRPAARSLAKNPAFTFVVVLTLALCIGANTAIFSLIKGFFLKPLPVRDAGRLVALYSINGEDPRLLPVSYLNYLDYRRDGAVFSDLAAWFPLGINLGNAGPQTAEIVSGNYFELLGVRAAHGRTFLAEEDSAPGAHPVVVMSHRLWQSQFGGDPSLVGRSIELNHQSFTVIGIAPEGFSGLNRLRINLLWVPIAMHAQVLPENLERHIPVRGSLLLNAVGRLRPGISPAEAKSALKVMASRLEREYPEDNKDLRLSFLPLAQATIRPEIRRTYVLAGALLMSIAGLLLLVGCASVANLLVVRALARQREVAVRASLGAGRSQLVRYWLAESVILTFSAALLGVLVGVGLRNLLWALRPPFLPGNLDFSLDGRVLGFTLLVSIATGLLFGLAPLPQLFRTDLVRSLRQVDTVGHGLVRAGLRNLLVVVQVTISLIALVGAGLFLKSLWKAQSADLGFNADRLLVASFDVKMADYDESRGRQFADRLVERVESLPGVATASVARELMLVGGLVRNKVSAEGGGPAAEGDLIRTDSVGTSYLETVGIPLLRGRRFTSADREGAPRSAIVNEALAQRFWSDREAVGQRLQFEGLDQPVEVVGVMHDARQSSISGPAEPCIYLPFAQSYSSGMALYVRTEKEPLSLIEPLKREVRRLDPNLPLLEVDTMANMIGQLLWGARLGAGLLVVFGGLALLLCATGLYSVMAYSVRQRRRELGIRLALGARRRQVLRLVILRGMVLAALGVAVGIAAVLALAPRVAGLLLDVSPTDKMVVGIGALILLGVALLASYLPAKKAAALDPVLVIRDV